MLSPMLMHSFIRGDRFRIPTEWNPAMIPFSCTEVSFRIATISHSNLFLCCWPSNVLQNRSYWKRRFCFLQFFAYSFNTQFDWASSRCWHACRSTAWITGRANADTPALGGQRDTHSSWFVQQNIWVDRGLRIVLTIEHSRVDTWPSFNTQLNSGTSCNYMAIVGYITFVLVTGCCLSA